MKSSIKSYQQQGSVLLISLGLLVVLTLMTFAVSNSVLLQEKMASANRDDALALQVAETALRDAEREALLHGKAAYTLAGTGGLYDGRPKNDSGADNCKVNSTPKCYIQTMAGDSLFDDDAWKAGNSIAATTVIACEHGDACPIQSPIASYQSGRFKLILLDTDFDPSISGSTKITIVDNQYQARDEGANAVYWLFKVIATGTGVDENNRRVLVSHFAAPANTSAP